LAENGFLSLANQLQIPAQTWEDARQGLANLKEPWLLVLDGADNLDVDYQQYFPAATLGVVLLTSRNADLQQYATTRWINLEGLSDKEARELLFRAARIPHNQQPTLKNDADAVVRLLLAHPLTLIQAGSYVSRGHYTLNEYPQVYQRQQKRLLTFRPS
jgi:cytochrome c-type biogenesis protein CcmH/NrfG